MRHETNPSALFCRNQLHRTSKDLSEKMRISTVHQENSAQVPFSENQTASTTTTKKIALSLC